MSPERLATSVEHDHALALLRYQPKPALVVDAAGTVVGVNPGALRLVSSTHNPGLRRSQQSVCGRHVGDLGVVLAPDREPGSGTWDLVLAAAARAAAGPAELEGRDQRTCESPTGRRNSQTSEDFWDLEAERQALIESSVYFDRSSEDSSRIKARATVCWYPSELFLIIFDRPSVPLQGRSPLSETERFLYFDDKTIAPPHYLSHTSAIAPLAKGLTREYRKPEGTNISLIIPYIMATLDVEGRVLQLSDSWYKFTGLSVEESLGSGWVSAIHPDDAVGIVGAWADVIQSNKQKWTYEARYRKASTGEYYWFLIRAHLYKNSSGQAACWYSSMMDVNDAVMGRQEVDGRRQSMISLISRTDVLLWGIDRENKLFIREGGLKWDPPELPSPAEIDKTGQASQSPNHNDHETLVYAVQAILAGRKFTPVIEHTEGERHFRTIFVAEGGASHKDVIGEAALALTFETTDQMVQSALRLDNKRLVTDERAASEANARKGRFLANVSPSPKHCSVCK